MGQRAGLDLFEKLFRRAVNIVFPNAYPEENAQTCSEFHAVSLLVRRVRIFLKLHECGDGRMSRLVGR